MRCARLLGERESAEACACGAESQKSQRAGCHHPVIVRPGGVGVQRLQPHAAVRVSAHASLESIRPAGRRDFLLAVVALYCFDGVENRGHGRSLGSELRDEDNREVN
jgi:hypothetical protein